MPQRKDEDKVFYLYLFLILQSLVNYEIEDVDLNGKLADLSLQLPKGLAFLPENLLAAMTTDDFVFTESVVEINKVFKHNDIAATYWGGDTELYRSRKNADIYLPAIFFSYSLISENPTIISVSLNVLSNYISDFLKGSFGRKTTHVDLYVETRKKGQVKKLSYKGDVEGLKDLEKILKELK